MVLIFIINKAILKVLLCSMLQIPNTEVDPMMIHETAPNAASTYRSHLFWHQQQLKSAPFWRQLSSGTCFTENSQWLYFAYTSPKGLCEKWEWLHFETLDQLQGYLHFTLLPALIHAALAPEGSEFQWPIAPAATVLGYFMPNAARLDQDGHHVSALREGWMLETLEMVHRLEQCWLTDHQQLAPEILSPLCDQFDRWSSHFGGRFNLRSYNNFDTLTAAWMTLDGEDPEPFTEVLEDLMGISLKDWQTLCGNGYLYPLAARRVMGILNDHVIF